MHADDFRYSCSQQSLRSPKYVPLTLSLFSAILKKDKAIATNRQTALQTCVPDPHVSAAESPCLEIQPSLYHDQGRIRQSQGFVISRGLLFVQLESTLCSRNPNSDIVWRVRHVSCMLGICQTPCLPEPNIQRLCQDMTGQSDFHSHHYRREQPSMSDRSFLSHTTQPSPRRIPLMLSAWCLRR